MVPKLVVPKFVVPKLVVPRLGVPTLPLKMTKKMPIPGLITIQFSDVGSRPLVGNQDSKSKSKQRLWL